jgi:hypothetical protein
MDKSLIDKLGLKHGQKAFILHAPEKFSNILPQPIYLTNIEELNNKCDWIQAFYYDKSVLEIEIDNLKDSLSHTGQLWISWPKKASKVKSDLKDNIVRQLGLDVGLVDVKVVSIDDTWSGLKFVYRIDDRK